MRLSVTERVLVISVKVSVRGLRTVSTRVCHVAETDFAEKHFSENLSYITCYLFDVLFSTI